MYFSSPTKNTRRKPWSTPIQNTSPNPWPLYCWTRKLRWKIANSYLAWSKNGTIVKLARLSASKKMHRMPKWPNWRTWMMSHSLISPNIWWVIRRIQILKGTSMNASLLISFRKKWFLLRMIGKSIHALRLRSNRGFKSRKHAFRCSEVIRNCIVFICQAC